MAAISDTRTSGTPVEAFREPSGLFVCPDVEPACVPQRLAWEALRTHSTFSGRLPGAELEVALGPWRGGLAPRQVRRVSRYIEQHLSERIRCEHLAALVHLSLSHFMRAFRQSFGFPPHAYLMKRRLECAQGRMRSSYSSLGEIALECGFTDQAHLSRLFRRFTGESPAAWRRARLGPSAAIRVMPVRRLTALNQVPTVLAIHTT